MTRNIGFADGSQPSRNDGRTTHGGIPEGIRSTTGNESASDEPAIESLIRDNLAPAGERLSTLRDIYSVNPRPDTPERPACESGAIHEEATPGTEQVLGGSLPMDDLRNASQS